MIEFDERQHFTGARATTLDYYHGLPVAFDVDAWRARARSNAGQEPEPGGGFARPCPPLFPGPGGRHRQRAFRDMLADVLPIARGWRPTARIDDTQARSILDEDATGDAAQRHWRDITSGSETRTAADPCRT